MQNQADRIEQIRMKLEEIGPVGLHESVFEFKYKIVGKRKISDFRCLQIMRDVQEMYLMRYPIIKKMVMEERIIEVELGSGLKCDNEPQLPRCGRPCVVCRCRAEVEISQNRVI